MFHLSVKKFQAILLCLIASCCATTIHAQSHVVDVRIGTSQYINHAALSLFATHDAAVYTINENVSFGWNNDNGWVGITIGNSNTNLSCEHYDEHFSMLSLGAELRHYTPITENLSTFNGLKISALYANNQVEHGAWNDEHNRWGATVSFLIGLAWSTGSNTQWNIMYEVMGGAFLSQQYTPQNDQITLPAHGGNSLWGSTLTIGLSQRF